MSVPLVTCASCEREWNSETMAEGLRSVGQCPRCGGELSFAATAPEAGAAEPQPSEAPQAGEETAPHLVLGIPRR